MFRPRWVLAAVLLLVAHPTFAAPADSLRLPADVLPLGEALELHLDPSRDGYDGTVTVSLRILAATNRVVLHAKDLDLHRVELADAAGRTQVHWGILPGDRLWIESVRPLRPGPATLAIAFRNDYDRHANALYRFDHDGVPYLATQFEAVAAREAFPCWDEPGFKIPWSVTLSAPVGQRVIGNSRPRSIRTERGWRTVVLSPTPPLPSYLLAFFVGPYETVPIPGLRVPGRVVTVRGGTRLSGFARREAPALLAGLERWFGRPYPYDKLDLIALPDFVAGAMENAGAVTFTDAALLVDERTVSPDERMEMVNTLAHELAHQWFGDLVTMAWWDDLWLNESFANLTATRLCEQRYGAEVLATDRALAVDGAMTRDARSDTRAIRAPVEAAQNLDLLFDEIAYEKGEAVLGMLEHWLGPEVFRSGVRRYLAARANGSATAGDLWRALGEVSGRDVAGVARTFTDQPGVPLVTLVRLDDLHVRLTQRRFAAAGTPDDGTRWTLPLTLVGLGVWGRDSLQCVFSGAETTLTLPHPATAVLPDADARAYARWAVPVAQLAPLLDAAPRLTARERAGLVPALGSMLVAGALPGDGWVDGLRQLGRRSDDPALAILLVDEIGRLRTTFGATPPAARAAWVRDLLEPAQQAFGARPRVGEPLPVTRARAAVVTARVDLGADEALAADLRPLAEAELANGEVPASLAAAALLARSVHADTSWVGRLLQALHVATEPVRRDRVLDALGAVSSPDALARALPACLDPTLSPREISKLVGAFAADPARQDALLDFVAGHFEAFASRLPAYSLAEMPRRFGGCSTARVARAEALFAAPAHRVTGTESQVARARAEAAECEALAAREQAAVTRAITAGR